MYIVANFNDMQAMAIVKFKFFYHKLKDPRVYLSTSKQPKTLKDIYFKEIGSSDLTEVSSEPETTLVIVSTAPSSDLGQSSGSVEDTQLGGGVFQLTGPILQSQSDSSDLMVSPVDSDSCKDKLVDSPSDHQGVDS